MNLSIWKFPLNITDCVTCEMPEGAEILAIQMQRDVPCIWAKVDTTKEIEKRLFRIYGTGHPVEYHGKYIGTFQMESGDLVFHLFEVT